MLWISHHGSKGNQRALSFCPSGAGIWVADSGLQRTNSELCQWVTTKKERKQEKEIFSERLYFSASNYFIFIVKLNLPKPLVIQGKWTPQEDVEMCREGINWSPCLHSRLSFQAESVTMLERTRGLPMSYCYTLSILPAHSERWKTGKNTLRIHTCP